MKTYAFCSISKNKTDEQVARANACFTVLIVIFFV